MPRPAKLPDLSDVDITELKLMILAALKRHGMGPEWRRSMRGAQIGGMLDLCGGAVSKTLRPSNRCAQSLEISSVRPYLNQL